MKSIAIDKASEHLEIAKSAVEKLSLENGPKRYSHAWSDFLSQASRFYSKLEQGSKGCGKSEAWFGRRKHERRKDPLLRYIHHARNSDEHGLDYVVEETGSAAQGTFPAGVKDFKIEAKVMLDKNGKLHVRNAKATSGGKPTPVALVEPRMELSTVRDDIYKDKFDPPTSHLGVEIDPYDPEGVAALAVSYMEAMLDDAKSLPQHA